MKNHLKQNLILISFSLLAATSHAALMEKADLLELAEDAMAEEMCAKDAMQCLAITEISSCKASVKESLSACSETLPDSVEDMDEARDVTSALSACASKKFFDKHKASLIKNATSKVCQTIMGK